MKHAPTHSSPPHPFQFAILILSLASLVLAGLLSWGSLEDDRRRIIELADYFICAVFLVDFLWMFHRAPDKLRYMRWGWLDLISALPAAPLFRFGRIARVIRLVRILRIVRGLGGIKETLDRSRATSALLLVLVCSFMAVIVGATLILEWEKGAEGNIQSGEDALWWAFVTTTTVGYGDYFPVTAGGRVIAVVLMTLGIGLFGTFTGFVATWFEAPDEKEDEERDRRLLEEVGLLRREIAELREAIDGR